MNELERKTKLEEIHLRMHQVRSLKELRIGKGVFNTEALMLVLNKKYRTSDGRRMLLKYLDAQDDEEVMHRKEATLAYLNSSPYKEVEELVIPEFKVMVDSEPAGFAMPLIENHKNLGSILHSPRIPFQTKKKYLIELGNLIDKVDRVDAPHKFSFSDLNEYNFIIDEEGKLRAIDLDSSYVEGLEGITPAAQAYYLLKNQYIAAIPEKYASKDDEVIIPSKNTDLYSYNMILLATLANESIFKLDMWTYYRYIDFLKKLGLDQELIDIFINIYSRKPNKSPRGLIETIPDNFTRRASYKVFEKRYLNK